MFSPVCVCVCVCCILSYVIVSCSYKNQDYAGGTDTIRERNQEHNEQFAAN